MLQFTAAPCLASGKGSDWACLEEVFLEAFEVPSLLSRVLELISEVPSPVPPLSDG